MMSGTLNKNNLNELFSNLNQTELDVLGLIAMDIDQGHDPRIIESLLDKGLIEKKSYEMKGFPPVLITNLIMPIHVHIAWCQWCSKQFDETY